MRFMRWLLPDCCHRARPFGVVRVRGFVPFVLPA